MTPRFFLVFTVFLFCLSGIAGSDEKIIWVLDNDSNELIRLSEGGAERVSLGGLKFSRDIEVDKADRTVWVADTNNNRVFQASRYGKDKAYIIDDDIIGPHHVAVSPQERALWVTNALKGEVIKFSLEDKRELFRVKGFKIPHDIMASAYDGIVWVGDNERKELIRISPQGRILSRLKKDFLDMGHLAVDPRDGSCWVTTDSHLVVKVSSDGRTILAKIEGIDGFMAVIDPKDGGCWVSDFKKGEVVKISSGGQVIKRVGGFTNCLGMSEIDARERVFWLANSGKGEIVKLNTDGEILSRIGGFSRPVMIALGE